MRIAFLVESTDLGGGERVVSHLMQSAICDGFEVRLIVPATQSEGWLCHFAASLGIQVHLLQITTQSLPRAILQLSRLLQEEKIEVVNAHMALMAFVGAVSSKLAGIPCALTLHNGDERWGFFRRLIPLALAVRIANRTIAVSAAMALEIESRLFLRKGTVQVIPNGSPNGSPRIAYRGDQGRVRIVLAGTCTKNKHHALFVLALDRITSSVRISVVIAGRPGDGTNDLEAAISSSRYRDSICLLGHVENLSEQLDRANLFVLCSQREGMPMVVVEAMLAGLPVISTNVGGVPEIIQNGRTGLLFESGNVEQLAETLQRCIDSPELRESLGSNAQRFARSRLTVAHMWAKYQAMLSTLSGVVKIADGHELMDG
jgi:glycosyltransferase involved in cell wall biosynthesis